MELSDSKPIKVRVVNAAQSFVAEKDKLSFYWWASFVMVVTTLRRLVPRKSEKANHGIRVKSPQKLLFRLVSLLFLASISIYGANAATVGEPTLFAENLSGTLSRNLTAGTANQLIDFDLTDVDGIDTGSSIVITSDSLRTIIAGSAPLVDPNAINVQLLYDSTGIAEPFDQITFEVTDAIGQISTLTIEVTLVAPDPVYVQFSASWDPKDPTTYSVGDTSLASFPGYEDLANAYGTSIQGCLSWDRAVEQINGGTGDLDRGYWHYLGNTGQLKMRAYTNKGHYLDTRLPRFDLAALNFVRRGTVNELLLEAFDGTSDGVGGVTGPWVRLGILDRNYSATLDFPVTLEGVLSAGTLVQFQTSSGVAIAPLLTEWVENTEEQCALGFDDLNSNGVPDEQDFDLNGVLDSYETDTDADGLTDGEEINTYDTDPLKFDTDGDGLWDAEELLTLGTDPKNSDSDADGLTDYVEVRNLATNPLANDTDADGLIDSEEVNFYFTNPLETDSDSDGLLDGDEINVYVTSPTKSDSDSDGLTDYDEVNVHNTNPLDADSDLDGLIDGDEVLIYLTNPSLSDSDFDGLSDPQELFETVTNPLDADSDLDGLIDGDEVNIYVTSPVNSDSDGDGLTDGDEVNVYDTSPTNSDSDGDGLTDTYELNVSGTYANNPDSDGDGLSDGQEVDNNSNPFNSDTDSDGLGDSDEVLTYLTNPSLSDSDFDGLSDPQELFETGTNPLESDSDGDFYSDSDDLFPLDPNEWADFDGDGLGDNTDPDDDNDLVSDNNDLDPFDPLVSNDSDSNGLPDHWELYHFGFIGVDPSIDIDGDGLTARMEFVNDSNPYLYDQTQQIYSEARVLRSNQVQSLVFQYNVSDGNNYLAGMGLRIHFNSQQFNRIDIQVPENVYALLEINNEWQYDDLDLDADPRTDHYVSISWADIYLSWPGGSIPYDLFELKVVPTEQTYWGGEAIINFSPAATSERYALLAEEMSIPILVGGVLDIDGDGKVKPLADGMMILRHLFGFTGDFNKITSSEGQFSEDWSALESRLEQRVVMLDIDADGQVRPLTDGLLLIRYLFGFRNAQLTSDAIGPQAKRTDPLSVGEYIESLKLF